MGHHVVGHDDIRVAVLGDHLSGQVDAEEADHGGHAGGVGCGSRTGCRIDAEDRHAGRDEVAQQVAVVAGDLDGERVGPQVSRGQQALDVGGGMAAQLVGERRVIGIVLAEDGRGRELVGQLHQRARPAEHEAERIALVAHGRVVRIDQRVGNRGVSEVEDPGQLTTTAGPATFDPHSDHCPSLQTSSSSTWSVASRWRICLIRVCPREPVLILVEVDPSKDVEQLLGACLERPAAFEPGQPGADLGEVDPVVALVGARQSRTISHPGTSAATSSAIWLTWWLELVRADVEDLAVDHLGRRGERRTRRRGRCRGCARTVATACRRSTCGSRGRGTRRRRRSLTTRSKR